MTNAYRNLKKNLVSSYAIIPINTSHIRQVEQKTERKFSEPIEDSYGSSEQSAKILDLGIEMMLHIEEDTFDRKDIQSAVSAIKEIVNASGKGK